MRVVHLVPALFGPAGIVGGGERYPYELARHMSRSVPTTLVSFGSEEREEQVGDLRVRVIGDPWLVRGQRTNPMSVAMFKELRQADVIHCHQQHVLMSSVSAIWSRLTRRRVFVSDLGGGGWDISAYLSTDRWFHGHLHISAYSRRVAGHDRNDRARVISGGVDSSLFSPQPGSCEAVLFVGRLLPHKGVHDLIDALPPRVPLRIVGRAMDAEYLNLLRARAAGKCVTFLHDVDDPGLVEEYRRAACVVLPSVYTTPDGRTTVVPELLGQTLLEAMACGRPAICTNVASMPEIVVNGETGYVVPPGNPPALGAAISAVLADADAADRMGARGRARVVEHFSWSKVVDRCLAAYRA